MADAFQKLAAHLTGSACEAVSGVDVAGQFRPGEDANAAALRNLNAAFGLALAGDEKALSFLMDAANEPSRGEAASFYLQGLELIREEVRSAGDTLKKSIEKAVDGISGGSRSDAPEPIREVFFPEGLGISDDRDTKVSELRGKRRVKVERPNPSPITDPARELLFTSNVLLTVPLHPEKLDSLGLSDSLRDSVRTVLDEQQQYWYDHPIPIGIAQQNNEALYGVRGLDQAVAFEKQRGVVAQEDRVRCVLSVSVTHEGLQPIAKQYLEEVFRNDGELRHLDLYVFSETDTRRLLDEVIMPSASHYPGLEDTGGICDVFGVDGKYGRHYTFLKAIAALWQVLVEPEVRGTFKTDLDQIFPQEELVAQAGKSAFEHFRSPLWGAEGTDSRGRPVELGMIAGALVNERDIGSGIFTPDVGFPPEDVTGEQVVFQSGLPQALSTEAEMMARYDGEGGLDGESACIERIHVTGGTNGILVESLRRHRPFTPVFIGRAEDQAYIMSRLFEGGRPLRYFHSPGLIMRHDKEAFASEAMKAAATGKLIGDYARILWFSHYARALPWGVEQTKDLLDPFTGCFISHLPFTVACLRLMLRGAQYFENGNDTEGAAFLELGTSRLKKITGYLSGGENPLKAEYEKERRAWDAFYDTLDRLEEALQKDDPFARDIREKARGIVDSVRLRTGREP